MAIDSVTNAPGVPSLTAAAEVSAAGKPAGSAGQGGFNATLRDWLGSVDTSASQANDAVRRMLDGTGDVHEAMIALQKADVALQLTVQIRNKLIQAYQDVMRMSV
jgi:flagellar hook-basal body complex protein FliE